MTYTPSRRQVIAGFLGGTALAMLPIEALAFNERSTTWIRVRRETRKEMLCPTGPVTMIVATYRCLEDPSLPEWGMGVRVFSEDCVADALRTYTPRTLRPGDRYHPARFQTITSAKHAMGVPAPTISEIRRT